MMDQSPMANRKYDREITIAPPPPRTVRPSLLAYARHYKMANLLARQIRLMKRFPSILAVNKRSNSIFTKEREPPNGFLFNEKPRLNGEKRKWEEWEAIWYRWWIVSVLILGVGFYYRPDTSLGTWAREEALRQINEKDAQEATE